MSDIQKIYKVEIDNTPAELEITENRMKCMTVEKEHFDVSLDDDVRAYEFQKPNKVAMNIIIESKMYFVLIKSKYALQISDNLKNYYNSN